MVVLWFLSRSVSLCFSVCSQAVGQSLEGCRTGPNLIIQEIVKLSHRQQERTRTRVMDLVLENV